MLWSLPRWVHFIHSRLGSVTGYNFASRRITSRWLFGCGIFMNPGIRVHAWIWIIFIGRWITGFWGTVEQFPFSTEVKGSLGYAKGLGRPLSSNFGKPFVIEEKGSLRFALRGARETLPICPDRRSEDLKAVILVLLTISIIKRSFLRFATMAPGRIILEIRIWIHYTVLLKRSEDLAHRKIVNLTFEEALVDMLASDDLDA